MSRQVDLSQPLSDEDREYLIAHGDHDLVRQADAIAAVAEDEAEFEPFDEGDGERPEEVEEAEEESTEDEESDEDETEEDDDEEETEEDGPYAGWTKADLKAEAGKRELPKSGNVAELKARLAEDDESKSQS